MKVNKLTILKKSLEEEYKVIQNALNTATTARDSAPSAMESHSDTTRNQSEKLASNLNIQLTNLKKLIESLPYTFPEEQKKISLWSLVQLVGSNSRLSIILVPEGYGGKEYDNVKLVSIQAPIGKYLLGKKTGDNISIIDNKYIISSVG